MGRGLACQYTHIVLIAVFPLLSGFLGKALEQHGRHCCGFLRRRKWRGECLMCGLRRVRWVYGRRRIRSDLPSGWPCAPAGSTRGCGCCVVGAMRASAKALPHDLQQPGCERKMTARLGSTGAGKRLLRATRRDSGPDEPAPGFHVPPPLLRERRSPVAEDLGTHCAAERPCFMKGGQNPESENLEDKRFRPVQRGISAIPDLSGICGTVTLHRFTRRTSDTTPPR
jgi:hypothetical protein